MGVLGGRGQDWLLALARGGLSPASAILAIQFPLSANASSDLTSYSHQVSWLRHAAATIFDSN